MDEINFEEKTFYNVEITKYANLTLLKDLPKTKLNISIIDKKNIEENEKIKNIYKFNITNIGENICLLLELKLYKIN